MSNKFVELFARMSPEGQEREQADEMHRLQSGEMEESEWRERSAAWCEIGRRDFSEADALEAWQRARQREAEKSKLKPWERRT
jgi:hypothetical protein